MVGKTSPYNSGSPEVGFTPQSLSSYTNYKVHLVHSSFSIPNLAHTNISKIRHEEITLDVIYYNHMKHYNTLSPFHLINTNKVHKLKEFDTLKA